MSLIQIINTFLAPLSILILIFLDYNRNKTRDFYQRKLFVFVLWATTAAMFLDIAYDLLMGMSGEFYNMLFYWTLFLFYIMQQVAYNATVVFYDYTINVNLHRAKILSVILASIVFIEIVLLLINIKVGFIFSTSPDNRLIRGEFSFVRLAFSYSPILLSITDVLLSRKNISRHKMILCLLFLFPASLGGILDLTVDGMRLVWPSFSISLLFAYLFIVQTDHRLDALTGVNNRRALDEFLDTLDKTTPRKPYMFVMIDMDHFKQINDMFGHLQGDAALRDAAHLIRGSVRRQDFIARYGGDEFVIVLKDTAIDNAGILVDRIHHNISDFNVKKQRKYTLALSIGYDIYAPDNEMTPQEFLAHVDAIMYKKKVERRTKTEPNLP